MKTTDKIAISVVTVMALSTGVYATCASDVDMGNNKITNVGTPTATTDAANKGYVDDAITNASSITAPTGYEVIYVNGIAWLDRNLGATTACTTVDGDATCHGGLYQWGRPADGHQVRTSGTHAGPTGYTQPNHGDFLTVSDLPCNWLSNNVTHLWSFPGASANGVCPAGWSVPAEQDFKDLSLTSSADAFSKIKLSESGYRGNVDGTVSDVGSYGSYWTATVNGEYSRRLLIYSDGAPFYGHYRAYGFSVRCVKYLD